jgi:hypothetical protein
MKRCIYAALLVFAAPLGATEADPLAELSACIARLDTQLDVGYERIAARCPDLTLALERSGWAAWLPRGWKEPGNDLSAGSLSELRVIVQRELAPRPLARTPRVERLSGILTDLGSNGQQGSSVWARFKQWLRSLFQRGGEERDDGWFGHMLERMGVSDAAIQLITYIALGGIVALGGFIVFNELRAAGVLGRRGSGRHEGAGAGAAGSRSRPTLRDVEQAALAERPRLLLEMIAAKLTDLKRLPPAGAFTVRELTRAAHLREESDRARLSELALAAERARFAEGDIERSVVDTAVAHGRALLTSLDSTEQVAHAGVSS